MTDSQPPAPIQPNTLGNISLGLGVASAALVFGIGFCALVGAQQGWVNIAGTPLYICGASSAFLGLIGAGLGLGGLFGQGKPRAAAIAGLVMGALGVCMFLVFLSAVAGG